MYILYTVEYPGPPVSKATFEKAWKAAKVAAPVPTFEGDPITTEAIAAVVRRTLLGHGAVEGTEENVEMEVPDDSGQLLERLEDFYHRLYPKAKTSAERKHFTFEKLEWLGQY